jgi:hypothetical protein
VFPHYSAARPARSCEGATIRHTTQDKVMGGFITITEIQENKDFIIDNYGELFYNECMKAEGETFLGMLVKFGKI